VIKICKIYERSSIRMSSSYYNEMKRIMELTIFMIYIYLFSMMVVSNENANRMKQNEMKGDMGQVDD
jgi:hypothetical protein